MSESSRIVVLGGDIESSLSHPPALSLWALLREAARLTFHRGSAGVLLALLAVTAIWLLLGEGVARWLGATPDPRTLTLLGLLSTALLAPLTGGLEMMGLQRAVGLRVRASRVFDYWRFLLPLAGLSLLVNVSSAVLSLAIEHHGGGNWLTLLPSVLFSMLSLFCVPLMLERGCNPLTALWLSVRLFVRCWQSLLLLHLLLLVLLVVALLPMGLGLLLLTPFYLILRGLLYREICGVRVQVVEDGGGRLQA
ncbi:hypothetical protein ABHF91_09485 [Pseudaeromonas sp. ZJS20]|uniref:hypothetical protein n=1 Tax=Pseudaeromonas aegiceratis TaxID=3153928 RepID=UPI00390C4AFE